MKNKIFSLLMAVSMVAATVVLPTSTVLAKDGDYIYNLTFDGENAATEADYLAQASTNVVDGTVAGLDASDKILKITGGMTTDTKYFANVSRGTTFTQKHVTVQFELWENNLWSITSINPQAAYANDNRYGIYLDQEKGAGAVYTIEKANDKTTQIGTRAAKTWNEYAIEYDLNTLAVKYYLNGTCIKTIENALDSSKGIFEDLMIGGSYDQDKYINNFKVYQGAYGSNKVNDEPETPSNKTFLYNLTFDGDNAATEAGYLGQASGNVVDGTNAGLDASDKICQITAGKSYFADVDRGTTFTQNHITMQFEVYQTNLWASLTINPQAGYDKINRYGIGLDNSSGAGKVYTIEKGSGLSNQIATRTKNEWYEFAIEYDLTTLAVKYYVDGVCVKTIDNALTSGTGIFKDFQIGGSLDYPTYINNFQIYEGPYGGTPVVEDVALTQLGTFSAEYTVDEVNYVEAAVTSGTIDNIASYDKLRVTDGVSVKEKSLSEIFTTVVTDGSVDLGILVRNIPAANKDGFKAKLVASSN